MRACGTCTLCCHVLGVKEIEKPPLQWCQHCTVGVGCQVYDERPQQCRDFSCLWLSFPEAFPEELKPNRCGVVCWSPVADGRVVFALTRPHAEMAWQKAGVHKFLRKMANAGHVVIAFGGGPRAWLIGSERDAELPPGAMLPNGDFDMGIIASMQPVVGAVPRQLHTRFQARG